MVTHQVIWEILTKWNFNLSQCFALGRMSIVHVNDGFSTLQFGARYFSISDYFLLSFAECDGVFLSNGPGDPTFTTDTINNIRKFTERTILKPLFGICFGHQLLGLAVGCKSFKMKLVEENLVPAFFCC